MTMKASRSGHMNHECKENRVNDPPPLFASDL